jgi:hypothetical protein
MSDSLRLIVRQESERPVAWLVAQTLGLVHAGSERELAAQRSAVALLQDRGDETTHELRALYSRAEPSDYSYRWSLLYLASLVKYRGAIGWLIDTAAAAIPAVRHAEPAPCETAADSEVLVRVMATEAVGALMEVDRELAADGLLRIIERQGHVSVRASAVQLLLGARTDLQQRIRQIVPAEQRFILDLKRVRHTELMVDPGTVTPRRNVGRSPKLAGERSGPAAPCCSHHSAKEER